MANSRPATDTEHAEPDVDENGVDRRQIRAMLELAPEDRLKRIEEFVDSVAEIRRLNGERPLR